MIVRKKYLLGGLVARGLSAAAKKFLKEGSKKFPKSVIKEGITKSQKTQADTFRKAKIVEYAHNKLQKLGANIFKGDKIKTKGHFGRADKMGTKIVKDQNKLERMVDMLKNKNLKAQGRKPNFKGGLIKKPRLAKRGF
jgi:hypothetical protein